LKNDLEGASTEVTATQACGGIVCFAGVDWWYHNRGHSECQIMTRLARRLPVLWVNSIGMRMPRPGSTQLPLRRYVRKLKSTFKGLRRDPSGLWVYSPIFIPSYSPGVLALNAILLNAQVAVICRHLKIRNPSAWITLPTAGPALRRGHWVRTVFNRSDAFSAFPEVDSKAIEKLEERLITEADEVIYVSRDLYEAERGKAKSAHLLDHGVDYEHFSQFSLREEIPYPPKQLNDLPRPIVGFYGALDSYTIDLELMIQVARQIRPGTLLVIGPEAMDLSRLLREPNVSYLGPVPYSELPRFAAHFDIGIMPWLKNDWIERCNPIKLKEYLALGFPVVTTRFPELRRHENAVYAADSHEEFLDAIDHALKETDPAKPQMRRESVADSSWDMLADRVADLLGVETRNGQLL